MMKAIRMMVVGVVACGAAAVSAAEKAPELAKPGTVLFEDSFKRAEMAPEWRVGKGSWKIEDGVVKVAEIPDDKHGAYAYAKGKFADANFIAEFGFKFDGAKSVQFLFDDKNYKGSHAGHICRASITPDQVVVTDSKLGNMKNEIFDKMKDPQTTAEEKKQLQASIKDKTAAFKVKLDAAEWHTARVEVAGDEMLVEIDGKAAGYLKSEGIAHPTKTMVGFTVNGQSAMIRNVKVWDAAPASDWSGHRAEVIGTLTK